MPLHACIPYFDEANNLTGVASADVVGKTFLGISGNVNSDGNFVVATCGDNAKVFGVCEYDASTGQQLGVIRHGIVPVTVGAAGDLTAGQEVMSDELGKAEAWDGVVGHRTAGMCLSGAIAGSDAMILLYEG